VPNLSQNRQSPELIALGSAIKKRRLQKNVSQEHLALLAGVDRSYLGRVERGDNNVATLTLIKIATALELSLEELAACAGL
jgi:transcriptional regulator with XRE-family HTH domain